MLALLRAIRQGITRGIEALVVVVFALLTLDVLVGVVTRYVFGSQLQGTDEAATLMMVWIGLVGAALAYGEKSHLGLDVLVRAMDPGSRAIVRFAVHTVVLVFAALIMVYGGWWLVRETWQAEQMIAALGIRKAWMYLSMPVSGVLICLYALEAMIVELMTRGGGEEQPVSPAAVETDG